MLARPILGLSTFKTFLRYILAIIANSLKFLGLQSALAPLSAIIVILPFILGIQGQRQGLSIPFILPTIKVAPVSNAPVLPAETIASAFFSFIKFKPTTIEESFFLLIACTGLSSFSITSVVCIISSLLLSNS